MQEIPTDLPPELVPLSWLFGVWEGEGRVVTGTSEAGEPIEVTFRQRASFSHDGGPFANYQSQFWIVGDGAPSEGEARPDADGEADDAAEQAADAAPGESPFPTLFTSETGYWRLARPHDAGDVGPGILPPTAAATISDADGVEALRGEDGTFPIEVVIAHPTGVAELYYGSARGPRIDLATDYVARTPSAKEHAASSRMYGFVGGDLLWAWDLAANGESLSSHASARLERVD